MFCITNNNFEMGHQKLKKKKKKKYQASGSSFSLILIPDFHIH